MFDAVTINIIGVTAYTLMFFLFFWVSHIPGASKAGHYWLLAVLMILLARLNMLGLTDMLPKHHIHSIYAVCLMLEKYFLVCGLLIYLQKQDTIKKYRRLYLYASLAVALIITLFAQMHMPLAYSLLFSITQAGSLMLIAYLVFQLYRETHSHFFLAAVIALALYSLHWLTFTFAMNIPQWLAIGFIVGNLLNIITYVFYVSLELLSFQTRLVESEKEARELAVKAVSANKAKSEFLANMSHEIRTPMNGVLGMLALLLKSKLNDKQRRKAEIAHESGRMLLAILNDILDFSKIEAGKLTISPTVCDVHREIESIAEMLKPQIENKGLALTVNTALIEGKLLLIDNARLKQVIINLLNNAIKFTEDGGIIITAALNNDGNTQILTCSIADSGIGICPDKLDTLFDAFQQEDGSITRQYGGTGLGLTISKRLCELMNGCIDVTSKKGEGSCFTAHFEAPDADARLRRPE